MRGFPPEVIRKAFRTHRTRGEVAAALGVSTRTLARWLRDDPCIAQAGVDRAGTGRQYVGAVATPLESRGNDGVELPQATRRDVARETLARGGTMADAAQAAGVDVSTVRRWGLGRGAPGRPKGTSRDYSQGGIPNAAV
jgi:transposase-like protein